MSDMIRQMMDKKQGGGTDADNMIGQYASTVRQEQAPDGSMREYVWFNKQNEDLDFDSSDEEWSRDENSFKVYGNWNEYAQGQDEEGNMFLPDEDFPIIKNESGEWSLDEKTYDAQDRGYEATKGLGGPGASPMEDLMEKLGQMRGQGGQPAPGRKMMGGGKVIKRAGKNDVDYRTLEERRGVRDMVSRPTDSEPVDDPVINLPDTSNRGMNIEEFLKKVQERKTMKDLVKSGVVREYKKGGKFPDLNKDGKVTMADILMGRGVRRR
jgi:hypothetical protein